LTSLGDRHGGLASAADGEHERLIGVALADGPPVRRLTWPTGSPSWLVTGYDLAFEMLRDTRFSRSLAVAGNGHRSLAREMSVTEMDPPQHTRIRGLVSRAFSPRQVERLRPAIERKADALLSGMLRNGSAADLSKAFSAPLAFAAQCEVLGVPEAHRTALRARWLRRISQAESDPWGVYPADEELRDHLQEILADWATLSRGLFADLADRRNRGLISEAELTGIALSFFLDGPLLAENQLTNAVLCLLTHPGQLAMVREDPARLDRAIEELLRYSPACTTSLPRGATAAVVLDTTPIQAGDVLRVALPLTNRDPAVISAPGRLDLARADARHFTFGHGIHYCLAAHLTRMLMHVALTAVLHRLPELSLAVPEQDLRWHVTAHRRSVHQLPVTWSQRTRDDPGRRT
jgi:cytochrome P450